MAFVELDDTRCKLSYLNEGGANFVFRISPNGDKDLPPRLRRKLLRLRKKAIDDPEELLADTKQWLEILPSEHMIEHDLVSLPIDTLPAINSILAATERPANRQHDYWEGGTHGMLVTDMTPREGEHLIEIKPKWLTQSPTAPPNAKRCRTCALRAQRAVEKGIVTATDAQGSCPLDLVSDVMEARRLATARLTHDRQVQE